MTDWRFSTEDINPIARVEQWREAMKRINLPVCSVENERDFKGTIKSGESPLGMRFSLIESGPQVISGGYGHKTSKVWLAKLLEGELTIKAEGKLTKVSPGMIIFGRTSSLQTELNYTTPFKQISIKAPPLIIDPRLISPGSLPPTGIKDSRGIGKIFSSMLVSLTDVFDKMKPHEWRPIELSLTQFLISCVFSTGDMTALGGRTANQAAQFSRICRTIETHLGDPQLDTRYLAEREGVSVRYLQKLFACFDNTFSNYVRTRRLERCREDMLNPKFSEQTITEICFRWGFSSSAHFSRLFRQEYSLSPREFRQQLPYLDAA